MKNKNILQSIRCALRGMKSGFVTEHNFKIYSVIAVVFLIINIIISAEIYDYVILVILICSAFAAEYINTAIERICDRFYDKKDNDIEFIKDIGSAVVLISGFAFFIGEGIIIISKLL